MIRTARTALVGALTFGGLTLGLLLSTPAGASPKLPTAIEDRIMHLCEASSADLEGKRAERQCRAEWREKVERMSGPGERKIRLVVR
jgi:hypothetical protein